MNSLLKITPLAGVAALLMLGCQSSPQAASDGPSSGSSVQATLPAEGTSPVDAGSPADEASVAEDGWAYPAARTATLMVNGLACPF